MKYTDIDRAYTYRRALASLKDIELGPEGTSVSPLGLLPPATRADIAAYARTRINELLQALGVEVEDDDGRAEREARATEAKRE